MKKDKKVFGQYTSENHDSEIENDEFLEETAPLIGYVVHTFNKLEETLNSAICELVSDRTDEPGSIIIYKMTFQQKVDLFYRMVRAMEIGCNEAIPSIEKLIPDLKSCATLRNAVVHAEWYNMNEKGYTFVKLNFDKNGLQQHYWQFTPQSLEEIIELITNTCLFFDIYDEEKQKLLSR